MAEHRAVRPRWPAAVAALVAPVVLGAPRPGTVLGVFPTCVYVGLDGDAVVAVLAADALDLPIGVRLALPADRVDWGLEPGDEVGVGQGRVALVRADVVAARVRPASHHTPPTASAASAAGGPSGSPLGCPNCSLDGVEGLVGKGPGLTPSGDDLICGALLALHAAGALDAVAAVERALVPLLPRTTAISAALLRAALAGHAVPAVARLASGDETARAEVLAIGHTSGAALVAGIEAARHHLTNHADHPHHPVPFLEGTTCG